MRGSRRWGSGMVRYRIPRGRLCRSGRCRSCSLFRTGRRECGLKGSLLAHVLILTLPKVLTKEQSCDCSRVPVDDLVYIIRTIVKYITLSWGTMTDNIHSFASSFCTLKFLHQPC